ncbi:MAG: GntR family transcriptional regulator [Anaerolineales bacterium]|nr:GntR family transcriptional regulator [Anaerolineales bacterium]
MAISFSQQAYEAIKADIITCALAPSEQIVQSQLIEKYQFGTTPVREALKRLAAEGFVEAIPRFGYLVSSITVSDVHELFEVRSIVESGAARLAALRGSREQLERIAEGINFIYVHRDKQSYVDFLMRNSQFHRSIAVTAGNRRLIDLLSRLLDELQRVFHLGLDLKDSAEEMRAEHFALMKALLDRDPDRSEQIVQSQVTRSRERILEALAHRPARGIPIR